jgi:two-component system response regulator AtoC
VPQRATPAEKRILLTWVGSHDPESINPRTKRREAGPILSLLKARPFDTVYVLLNIDSKQDDFRLRATGVLDYARLLFPTVHVAQKPLDLLNPTDYTEVYRVMNDACQKILKEEGTEGRQYSVFLSPGTPQMQTVWVLLVRAGLLPAKMLMSTWADLVPEGVSTVREVDLSLGDFPQIVSPGGARREVGILQARVQGLEREVLRLQAELARLRAAGVDAGATGGLGNGNGKLPANFSLRDHLLAAEAAYYARALDEADGRASVAARLLGVDPAAFRARALGLGLRSRRSRQGSG